jgi:competence protein ComEA
MKKLRLWIRRYFGFSHTETSGFLILLLIMIGFLVLPQIVSWLQTPYDTTRDRHYLDSVTALLHIDSSYLAHENGKSSKPKYVARPHQKPDQPFDPNQLSAAEWEAFGVPKYVAERIKKYLGKGGSFKTKEDVQKMYGFPEEIFQEMYPFISLPARDEYIASRYKNGDKPDRKFPDGKAYADKFPRTKYAREKLQPFDLNAADTVQLRRIRGIGSKRAAAIVKYRDRLGGYISSNQLNEIFSLDSMARDSLRKYTFVSSGFKPAPVRINSATLEELKQHPYLKLYQAKAIIAYREQHGPFRNAQDLAKVKVLKPDAIARLAPYLSFE